MLSRAKKGDIFLRHSVVIVRNHRLGSLNNASDYQANGLYRTPNPSKFVR